MTSTLTPAIFPPRLFAPAAYYALMARCRLVAFDTEARYVKADKDTHRFALADANGAIKLTVPVSRPSGARLWKETLVSDHGRWWETMPTALESAYGRTPFFEFYIDRLMPLFSPEPISVTELCLRADAIVRGILRTPSQICAVPEGAEPSVTDALIAELSAEMPAYWQVRSQSLGFIGGLSVLDLIFNLGPEAELYLDCLAPENAEFIHTKSGNLANFR